MGSSTSNRSAMYSSDSGFDASLTVLARRRTASFTICTISPSSEVSSSRGARTSAVSALSRVQFGICRGSYDASCTGGSAKRRANIATSHTRSHARAT